MSTEKREKIKSAITKAKEMLEAAGADDIVIFVGLNLGSTIGVETTMSGSAYTLTKLIFQCGQYLISEIKSNYPEVVAVVELECLEEMAVEEKGRSHTTH